jgi:HSP20 family protein
MLGSGVDEKDLDITLADGMLTVRGEKKTERDEQDKDRNCHVVERSYGSFSPAPPRRTLFFSRAAR